MKGLVNNFSSAATRFGHKVAFKIKKASPEILLVGGIVCLVGGTIMACKATKKAEEVMDECKERVDKLHDVMDDETVALSVHEEKAIKHDIMKLKAQHLGKLAGVYAPSVALIAAGIAMEFTSHGIMKKRNGMLLASYNALDAMFKTYRQRVLSEEDGKERDRRYLTGRDGRSDVLTEDEMNELSTVDKINHDAAAMINVMNDDIWYDHYTCRFDANTSMFFSMHPFSNLQRIRSVEDIMSSRLMEKGYVCLNEVLHELGMDPVPWGQLVGRIYDRNGSDRFEIMAIEDVPDACGGSITLEFMCDDKPIWSRL